MTRDPYYGVEVIETGAGNLVVREHPAATCFVIGTAPVGDVHSEAEDLARHINRAVLVRSREEAIAAFGEHQDGYTLPAALDAIFDQAGPAGVGTIEVVNVFDPDVHANVAAVSNLDIVGSYAADGRPTGMQLAYDSYQRFGRFCKIILAPGFTGLTGVRAELETICRRIRARALLDAPIGVTAQDLIEARGPLGSFDFQFSNRRLVAVWPQMVVLDKATGGTRLDPYSSRLAGVWLSAIMENGYHHSPSNRPIRGIEDTEIPVLYIPGDKASTVQLLRDAGIVTIEERYGKGPHVSGNRSSAHPTDTDVRNFLHVQLIEDVLDEMMFSYLDQFKDRPGNNARLEAIEEGMNDLIKTLIAGDDPVLRTGQFRFDRTKTRLSNSSLWHFYFQLSYEPVGIMERLTVDRNIDFNLGDDAVTLAV